MMMPPPLKKNDLLIIEWNDAYMSEDQQEDEDVGMITKTLGWWTEQETDDYVGYAQDWNASAEKYQGLTYLPKWWIKQVSRVNDDGTIDIWLGSAVSELWSRPDTRARPLPMS
jgi:hypothetical protein